jgi:hypothetical protein
LICRRSVALSPASRAGACAGSSADPAGADGCVAVAAEAVAASVVLLPSAASVGPAAATGRRVDKMALWHQ